MGVATFVLRHDGTCKRGQHGHVLGSPANNLLPAGNCYSGRIQHCDEWITRYTFIRRNRLASLDHRRGAHIVGDDSCSPKLQQNPQGLKFKYLAEMSYDGTDYNGFQLQPKCPTIQGSMERALTNFCGLSRQELVVQGAARTDSGVHARQQFIEFYSPRHLQEEYFIRSMNRMIPSSISVHSLREVEQSFNVRYSQGKIYTYDIHLTSIRDPFMCRYRHMPRHPTNLDIETIRMACSHFVGTQDFRFLTNTTGDDTLEHDTRRHMYQVDARKIKDGLRIAVMGRGFMYKQVRNMAGVLLAVGSGTMTLNDIQILLQGDEKAVMTGRQKTKYKVAEAKGLTLQRVFLMDEPVPNEHDVFHLIEGNNTA